MNISVICCTYGRTKFLSDAISAFLQANVAYPPSELIVVNSFPKQKLTLNVPPLVRIINLNERPSSLGACRNIAIESATGEIIVQLDDDDIILPHHFQTVAKHFSSGLSWIWLDSMFYSEKGAIKKIVQGNISCVAYTKEAWKSVGGFSEKTVGEDKAFLGKLTTQAKGKKISIRPDEVGFVYCWDNGSPHISGLGEDEHRAIPSHQFAEMELNQRVKNGTEPIGEVVLKPNQEVARKWDRMAKEFVKTSFGSSTKKTTPAIVQLGRYGDVINVLPIAKRIADRYEKPDFIISSEFASVLEGVSYVNPVPVSFVNNEINRALEMARREYKFVLCSQIWGRNYAQVRHTEAYNVESWNNCGFRKMFYDFTIKPVFDQRNLNREQQLVNYVSGSGKFPFIVTCVKSVSSPFEDGQKLLNLIGERFMDRYRIADLSHVRAEKIFDLIGLFEKAACVVSIDSSPLHLAAACNVPVVALVNPRPWLGTVPRCNTVARIPYDQASRNMNVVLSAIEKAVIR